MVDGCLWRKFEIISNLSNLGDFQLPGFSFGGSSLAVGFLG